MDFYTMPLFNKLLVKNIEKSAKWYEEMLGFQSVFTFVNQDNKITMNHLRLAKYQDIMLIEQADFILGNALYINLAVTDLEKIAEKIPAKFIVIPLTKQPWNALELTIKDLDGHLITLTQGNLAVGKSFDEVVANISQEITE